MKKLLLILFACVLVALGVWYIKHHKSVKIISTTATYKNSETGISFTYPKILTVKNVDNTNNTVNIHHEVSFQHPNYCDFKGESATTSPTLTDFNVNMHTDNTGLADTMRAESPYIPAENFVNNQVVPSPGFIDTVTVAALSGYKIFEGAEGCGQTTYYFPISNNKTLVLTDDLITVFTGTIDQSQASAALAVPDIISKQTHDKILDSILQSLSTN